MKFRLMMGESFFSGSVHKLNSRGRKSVHRLWNEPCLLDSDPPDSEDDWPWDDPWSLFRPKGQVDRSWSVPRSLG